MDRNTWLKALNKLLAILQGLVLLSGWCIPALLLGFSIKSQLQPFLAMFLATLLGILGLVVHEGGHFLGARWCGMPVLLVRVAALEFQVLRRGWRLRWSPQPRRRRLGGYVIAASNAQRSLRGQWMAMVLCGPLSNLLVGGVALGLGLAWQGTLGAVLLAFAIVNLAMGVGNLIPSMRVLPSDGMLLLGWFAHRDDQRPELAQARLLALSVAGVPSPQLPQADLEWLARSAMPEPLVAFGYRLAARQEEGDWPALLRMEQELEELLEARSGELTGMSVLIELLRLELAFCRAYLQRDPSALRDISMGTDVDWHTPWLRPRCQALVALLEGDRQRADSCLQQAQQAAEASVILSQGKSEALLAAHLRALPGS
ncbi:site-2 protease family protein [Pseudomonas sp. L5B5]|uniref:site-2 protease family protein n=1 Tax=Pseudomonas sp. L5B5 TaxID=2883205 RepID=UPI001CFACA69|nr:site-2 protease family protein [Pseudomonas sp. L5B5]UCZ86265.1 site-2 protease family protein [Pseudomonas sp. L5B5]